MIGRLLCAAGWHKFKGTPVPHTYECVRYHRLWWASNGQGGKTYVGPPGGIVVERKCPAVEAGYP